METFAFFTAVAFSAYFLYQVIGSMIHLARRQRANSFARRIQSLHVDKLREFMENSAKMSEKDAEEYLKKLTK